MKTKIAVLALAGILSLSPLLQAWGSGGAVHRTQNEVVEIATQMGKAWCSIVDGKKVPGTFSASRQSFTTFQDQSASAKAKLKTAKKKHASASVIAKLKKLIAKLKSLITATGPACLSADVPEPVEVDPTVPPNGPTPTPRPASSPTPSGCSTSSQGATIFAQRCAACHSISSLHGRTASQITASIQQEPQMFSINLSSSELSAVVCFLSH